MTSLGYRESYDHGSNTEERLEHFGLGIWLLVLVVVLLFHLMIIWTVLLFHLMIIWTDLLFHLMIIWTDLFLLSINFKFSKSFE